MSVYCVVLCYIVLLPVYFVLLCSASLRIIIIIIMYVMIKANTAQFCGLVEIIVGGWIWLAHQAIGFKT